MFQKIAGKIGRNMGDKYKVNNIFNINLNSNFNIKNQYSNIPLTKHLSAKKDCGIDLHDCFPLHPFQL